MSFPTINHLKKENEEVVQNAPTTRLEWWTIIVTLKYLPLCISWEQIIDYMDPKPQN